MTISVDEAVARLFPCEAERYQPFHHDCPQQLSVSFPAESEFAEQAESSIFNDFCSIQVRSWISEDDSLAECETIQEQVDEPSASIGDDSCNLASCFQEKFSHASSEPIRFPEPHDFCFASQAQGLDDPIEMFGDFALNNNFSEAMPGHGHIEARETSQVHQHLHISAASPSVDACFVHDQIQTGNVATRSPSSHSEDGSEGSGKARTPWTKAEHEVFLAALERFRTNQTEKVKRNGLQTMGLGPGVADLIALVMKTRDAASVRSHAQKYFQRLRRQHKAADWPSA
jgi:hypothetical protein